jgi:hypothetical protein
MSSVDPTVVTAALLGVTGLTVVFAVLDTGGVVRLVTTVAFFLVVPGWAVVALTRPAAVTAPVVAVSVAVSVAVDGLVAHVMLLAGSWRPGSAFAVLAAVSAVLLVAGLVSR